MFKAILLTLCLVLSGVSAHAAESTRAVIFKAQQAYKNGQFIEAGNLFMEVAHATLKGGSFPNALSFLNNAALSYTKGKDFKSAIEIYTFVLSKPQQLKSDAILQAYTNLSNCYEVTGELSQKIATVEQLFERFEQIPDKETIEFYTILGDAYRRLELYNQALKYYISAYKILYKYIDEKNPETFEKAARMLNTGAVCQGYLGQFDAAEKNFSLAIEMSKMLKSSSVETEAKSNLGILYLERGEYAKAHKLLDEALSIAQKNNLKGNEGADQNNLGLLFKNAGDYKNALTRFRSSLNIARELKDKKGEATALVNMALLYRITGDYTKARENYKKAEGLFREIDFKEGIAGAIVGQGVLAQHADKDFETAWKAYNDGTKIYLDLKLSRLQVETLMHTASIVKHFINPQRKSRDLVFVEDEPEPLLEKAEAVRLAKRLYGVIVKGAQFTSSKELLWVGWQGMGYCLYHEGKYEEAYKYYMNAIDMVTSLRTSLAGASLLGEFMAKKEDLFLEAREVCAALFEKTKNQKYLEKQIQLDETLRNEIAKASIALTKVTFQDDKKQNAYESLLGLGKQQEKAEQAVPKRVETTKNMTADDKKRQQLVEKEIKQQLVLVKKLDTEYKKQLAAWEKSYPEDRVVFQSAARIDIKKIQKNLKPDQAVLQYLPLQNKLIIIAISKKAVMQYSVNVSQVELDNIVKKDFLVNYIEKYGRGKVNGSHQDEFKRICATLNKLYKYLVEPAESFIADKKKLYFVASGFLAQVPFVALTKEYDENSANFLVEKYDISQVRPAFIESLTVPSSKESLKTLLAVGNPRNTNLFMSNLKGALREVKNADASISSDSAIKDIRYEKNATELWFTEQLKNSQYEYIYFATHAMPFSDVFMSYINNFERNIARLEKRYKDSPSDNFREDPNTFEMLSYGREYIDSQLRGYSPMNGYLYMQAGKEFAFGKKQPPLPLNNDGLLTISDIMGLDKKSFEKTKVVILSACNTGVTFAPKAVKKDTFADVLSAEEIEKSLRSAGWVPGVDQVSFVDVFMRRGVSNVYGTLWFADDESSTYILSQFMKKLQEEKGNNDVVHTYSQTLRDYLKRSKASDSPINHPMPIHPHFWACGSFFGK